MQARDDRIDEDEFERNFPWDRRYRTLLIERDVTEAAPPIDVAVIRQQAVDGVVKAQIGWGRLLVEGAGVEPDLEAGFRWFNIAARSGDAEARNMVGRCYELGVGVAPHAGEAARWYALAAESGDAWAQFNLATLLAQGTGVAQDIPAAVSLLVRSSRRGNAKAMNMLGRLREDGVISAPKPRAAAWWYRRAAQRGCFRGQFQHARNLARAGDVVAAREWLAASFAQAPLTYRGEAVAVLRGDADARVRGLGTAVSAILAETA
jgi:TPR repeat protein